MKLIPECDVVRVDKDNKRNTKKRFLVTDGICLRCAAIVNYKWEKRCILCCGSEEFLVGESSRVLRGLLELDIELLKTACEVRCISRSGSRTKMTLELFKVIFPRLSSIDKRIDESLITKIITRNRKRFWYVRDIESAMIKARRCNIKLVDEKDMRRED